MSFFYQPQDLTSFNWIEMSNSTRPCTKLRHSCLPSRVHPQRVDVRGRAPQGVSPKLGRMDSIHRYGRHIIYRDLSSHVLSSICICFAFSKNHILTFNICIVAYISGLYYFGWSIIAGITSKFRYDDDDVPFA